MGVEDLLQKHSLVEADINVLGERVKVVVQQTQKFSEDQGAAYRPCDATIIEERIQQLQVILKISNGPTSKFWWSWTRIEPSVAKCQFSCTILNFLFLHRPIEISVHES